MFTLNKIRHVRLVQLQSGPICSQFCHSVCLCLSVALFISMELAPGVYILVWVLFWVPLLVERDFYCFFGRFRSFPNIHVWLATSKTNSNSPLFHYADSTNYINTIKQSLLSPVCLTLLSSICFLPLSLFLFFFNFSSSFRTRFSSSSLSLLSRASSFCLFSSSSNFSINFASLKHLIKIRFF